MVRLLGQQVRCIAPTGEGGSAGCCGAKRGPLVRDSPDRLPERLRGAGYVKTRVRARRSDHAAGADRGSSVGAGVPPPTPRGTSDQIEPSPAVCGTGCKPSRPPDQEPVAGRSESVGPADLVAETEDLVVAELDDAIARGAMQVVVRRVAVIVLEGAAIGQPQLAEQPGLDQQPERPVDRRPADADARRRGGPGPARRRRSACAS